MAHLWYRLHDTTAPGGSPAHEEEEMLALRVEESSSQKPAASAMSIASSLRPRAARALAERTDLAHTKLLVRMRLQIQAMVTTDPMV